MRGTPRGILPAHLADQRSDLGRNDGSFGLAAAHLPGPEQAKPGTMPGSDRFWLDDGERRAPATPEAQQTDPQQTVSRGQFQAFCSSSPKHTDLVTQSQVLELEGGTRSEDRRQSRKECHKSSEHRRNYERCNSHPFRYFEVFERHEGEGSWTKCQGFKPDLRNSVVRHYRGPRETQPWWNCEPASQTERARTVTLYLQGRRARALSQPRGNGEQRIGGT